MCQACVEGVSTRRVDLVKSMGIVGHSNSDGEFSRLAAEVDTRIRRVQSSPERREEKRGTINTAVKLRHLNLNVDPVPLFMDRRVTKKVYERGRWLCA
jgi:hypothetical protein